MASTDILHHDAGAPASGRARLAAFLPVTLAACGLAVLLAGGIHSDRASDMVAAANAVDPVITGSIAATPDRERALRHLDD